MIETVPHNDEIGVSISCITYNHAPYIRQALDGFIMQKTNFRFEVLIHDDCSTDGTDDIIREYAAKYPDIIKPLYEKENQYQNGKPHGSVVWNFPRAKGKYIALCEGDDYWTDPHKLQKQVDFLDSHQEYSMIFANVRLYYDSGLSDESLQIEDREYSPYELYSEWNWTTPTLMFRKSVYTSAMYKTLQRIKKPVFGDVTLTMSCAKIGKVWGMSDVVGVYRRLQSGATTRVFSEKELHFYNRSAISKHFSQDCRDYDSMRFSGHFVWCLKHLFQQFPNNLIFCWKYIIFNPIYCVTMLTRVPSGLKKRIENIAHK